MIIDILFSACIILAIFKGFSKGFILGLFSLCASLIGLAAALKLSVVVAHLAETKWGTTNKLLPFVCFILVFVAVMILVSIAGKIIKKGVQLAMMGWLDSVLGIILFLLLYTIIFSIFLFYAEKLRIIGPDTIAASVTYKFAAPWGPMVINNLGKIIPFFKDMFTQLEQFFGSVATKASAINL
ncbi:hypothetical protein BH09BAC2_BH09BAC2_01240 [soil metagenome]